MLRIEDERCDWSHKHQHQRADTEEVARRWTAAQRHGGSCYRREGYSLPQEM
jgi:hypothetical protein